ncbi:MAG: hypothetical protein R3F29_11575 [Planctomycetota bacterium]
MQIFATSLFLATAVCAQQAPSPQRVPREPASAPVTELAIPEHSQPSAAAYSGPLRDLQGEVSVLANAMADVVLFDEPHPGQLWAGAPTWKAHFDGTAATFVPCFGSDAPRNFPARFAVTEVRLAGAPLQVENGTPRRDGDVVSIVRGAMVEQYATSLAGIEQRFVFERLPQRGELVVSIAVESELQVAAVGGVHTFGGAFGGFEYGAAIAFDGRGRRTEVACSYVDGALRLCVPEQFVAAAEMPLVIDPLIGNVVTVGSSVVHNSAVDLAYDASRDEYLICFERLFSAVDSDVLGVRCNGALQPLAPQFLIDNSTTSWRGCRVAGLDLYDKFLVVCECEPSGQPTYIGGRVYDAAAQALGSPIDIERGAVACLHPDVGGDPYPNGPVYWTVVYERALSSTDHDIVIRQVQSTGALRGTSATAIDTSLGYEHSPVISKSDGRDGLATTQRWCVAYRRSSGSVLNSVRTSTVSWDGVVDPVQFASPWFPTADSGNLEVSDPTFEALGRRFLVVETRRDTVTPNREIWGALVGAGGVSPGWQELLNYQFDRQESAVACDGARFAVAYAANSGSLDVSVALFDVVGNQLVQHDDVVATNAATADGRVAIVSHASGGAGPGGERQFGVAWNSQGATSDTVGAVRYRGVAAVGGATTRSTGCGSLQVGYPGNVDFGALGTTIQTTVQNPVGIVGWGIGDVVSVPLPGCGSCVVGTSAIVLVAGPTAQVQVPYNGALVGLTFAFQAFSLGQGSCLGSLEFSDTIDVRIR